MSRILCLDTATDICTVSLFEGEKCVAIRESGEDRSHAVQLAQYIDEVLKEASMQVNELDAIAVSMGPGSYTGLRIGVSTVKGLCYGAKVPLIAISTLQAMCYGIQVEEEGLTTDANFIFCPMLDARRMEVYTALYKPDYSEDRSIRAEIIDDDSFSDQLKESKVIFFGNGADKTKLHIKGTNAIFAKSFKYSSQNMIALAQKKLAEKDFEDIAYFEPFYLKDFVATTPRKNVLG